MKLNDLYWLAGLLEGEGCFCYYASPGITLGMTDKDVVEHVADLFCRHVRGPYKYGNQRKDVYYTEIWAADAIALMKELLPFMGSRRSKKIDEIVAKWNKAPYSDLPQRWAPNQPAACHPNRKNYARGECVNCYQRNRYKRKGK